jgi:hypothetical protein
MDVCARALACFSTSAAGRAAQLRTSRTLTTGPAWSYRVAGWDGDLERLQRLGMLGWELVAIVRRCAIVKRPA